RPGDHAGRGPHHTRRRAAERPGAVAVVAPTTSGDTRRLSYAELDERSRRAARRLRALGVRDGAVVAVRMAKSPELIVTLLAVLRAGGCYLPLDPGHPADRTARLIADAGAVLLVADGAPDRREPDRPEPDGSGPGPEAVTLNELDVPAPDDPDPEPPISLDAPAYLIHTSGSTGRPKAVRVSHRSLAAVHAAWRAEYRLDDEVGVHLQMAAPSFDVFTGDLVRALCSGGTLLLADRDLLFDTHRLYRTMAEERVDCAEFVPAVARGLIGHCEAAGLRLDFLRLLIVGSDTWRAGEHRRLRALCGPRTRLVNSYGLTEATIDSAYFEGPVDGLAPGATVPIGRPLPNSELYVLDRYGEPVPPGVTGELFIGGEGLATGYLGAPEETARRFPTLALHGAPRRLCRTGDLARWSADGTVHLLGRADRQVKVRGHRVETGEVETQLSRCAGLRQVHVTTHRTDGGDNTLCAYYVPDEGARVDRGELRRRLADHLPAYMIPSHFVALPALPLTANGKVDTAALPAPAYEPEPGAPEAPATPYEARMAAHWQALLGGELLGPQHDFFAAGGNSLTLIELIHHLRTEYGTEIPVGPLFKDTTLRGMARTVEDVVAGEADDAPPYVRFGPDDPDDPDDSAPDRTVFCFPPAGGHGAVYRELAMHLGDFHLIAFDYLPDEAKAARYADLIESLRPAGPCALLGYSLGGNLAFEVAKELERRGREVSRLVLLDSYRFTEAGPLDGEQLARFEDGLRDRLGLRAGAGPLAAETVGQARDYLAFCCRTPNLGTVAAPITVIAAERSGLPYVLGKRAGWQESSRTGAVRLDGSGTHDELLDAAHLVHNARLAREALAGAECGVPA
ncbi:amino acid adenylation domain-containing protein, partial [Streptomyces sp. NPDC000151]|uniref:amino acid adenylation domain-containing protein n=1 Tax=Streptomyces sp. NPDC000151 TaxID=3154244 RepID=UPI00332E9EB2